MNFGKILNINNDDNKVISVTRILFVFYLIMLLHKDNLLGKQMKEYIDNNKIAQHVIVFITIYTLIIILGNISNLSLVTVYSIIIYFWYLFSTKLEVHWNIVILILLFIYFIYETVVKSDEDNIVNDSVLHDLDKKYIINKNLNIRNILTGGIIVVTIIGMFMYNNKKVGQYGGGMSGDNVYSLVKFLFG